VRRIAAASRGPDGEAAVTVHVQQLRPSQGIAAGELLAASHHEYPAFRHLFPDSAVRRRVLRPFMAAAARDAARLGHSVLARDDEAGAAGEVSAGTAEEC
jgi:hypothetical protein